MSLVETAARKLDESIATSREQAQVRELCVQLRQEWVPLLREHGQPVRHYTRLGEVLTYHLFLISSQLIHGLTPSQMSRGLVVERSIETRAGRELRASVYSLGKNPETSPQIVVTLEGLPQTLYLFKNRGAIVPGKLAHETFNYELCKPLIGSFGPTSLGDVLEFKKEVLDPLKSKL